MIRRFLAPTPDKIGISVIYCAMAADTLNRHKKKEKANNMSRQNIEIKPQHGPQMTPILGNLHLI